MSGSSSYSSGSSKESSASLCRCDHANLTISITSVNDCTFIEGDYELIPVDYDWFLSTWLPANGVHETADGDLQSPTDPDTDGYLWVSKELPFRASNTKTRLVVRCLTGGEAYDVSWWSDYGDVWTGWTDSGYGAGQRADASTVNCGTPLYVRFPDATHIEESGGDTYWCDNVGGYTSPTIRVEMIST